MARILLDIDNTLTTPDVIINTMADMFGKEYITSDDLKSYTMGKAFNVSREQERMFWELFGYQVLESSELNIATTTSIFNNIIKEDDYVIVMTARPHEYEFITVNWLKNHGIKYDELVLVGDNSKIGFIERYQIDTVIDDKPHLFSEIEVVSDLFTASNTAKLIRNGEFRRYVVDYPYNSDSVCEYRINRETGEIKEG